MSELKTPSYHEDEARKFEEAGDYISAAKEWRLARTASIGHKRRERYDEAAERCDKFSKKTAREIELEKAIQQIIDRAVPAGKDSTDRDMVKMRRALIDELRVLLVK